MVPVDVMYYQMQAFIGCQLRLCAKVLKKSPCEAALARLTLDCSRCLLGEPLLMLRPRAGGGDWLALQCAGDRSGRILPCIPACAALNLRESQRGNAHAWCQAVVLSPAKLQSRSPHDQETRQTLSRPWSRRRLLAVCRAQSATCWFPAVSRASQHSGATSSQTQTCS